MRTLTRRQREIVDFIAAFLLKRAYAPSLAEIGEHFQLTSLATIHKHLTNIAEKGYIRRRWGCARSIELVAQATGHCPTCGRALIADEPVIESIQTSESL